MKITDSDFIDHACQRLRAKKKEYLGSDGVHIRDEEQGFYYSLFRSEFGVPRGMEEGSKNCQECGAWLMGIMEYCRKCGAYPA